MDMEKVDKDRYDQLHAMSERVCELWRDGQVEDAIVLGEAEGDALQEKGDPNGAVEVWSEAVDQLPEPVTEVRSAAA